MNISVANDPLVIGMTNRVDAIDEAAKRKGRFDAIIKVAPPTEDELLELIPEQLNKMPHSDHLHLRSLAKTLQGRPLSDLDYVLKEAAYEAAKNNKQEIDQESIDFALKKLLIKPPAPHHKNVI